MIVRSMMAAAIVAAAFGFSPAHAESGVRVDALDRRATHGMAIPKTETKDAGKAKKQSEREIRKARIEARKRAETKARIDQNKLDREAAKKRRKPEAADAEVLPVAASGNSGELRSESPQRPAGLFSGLFGGQVQSAMLPETRALDRVLEDKQRNKKFRVKADFEPQSVAFSGYPRGTIVIDTASRYLYLVESSRSARRYAIAVGREGLAFTGSAKVGDKQEWPRWIPTKEMQEREPKKYGQYKDGMNGGPSNPLGARAIYLYQGKKDTHIRIHGTNQPETIGTASSNGCFRMVNEHVMDLYGRVRMGTDVVVVNGLS